jgi:ABC-type polysaccharide/polyol phosphate transport system ATPase subunit
MTEVAAVRVDGLSKRFRIYHQRNQTLKQTVLSRRRGLYEEFWALNDVSLEIPHGTTFGIVGQNGSGKSTLLKCIAGILRPDKGTVDVDGRLAALLELGAGFHPEYTGRENIYLNGALLGLSRRDIDGVLDQIIDFSGLSRFIDNAVKTYSSGMYARLGFSIAVHLYPDILVVDEILAVGDASFQRRCYQRIDEMKASGKTLIMVSHALDAIRDHCADCAWIDEGNLRAIGPAEDVLRQYMVTVREREAAEMEQTVADIHRAAPSGRAGVGISQVSFSGPNGSAREFETGDPLEVAVAYHSPWSQLRGARFELGFLREDGVLAFTATFNATNKVLPGNGEVVLRLPQLELLAGLYRVSATIDDSETGEPYTILANAFPFRVAGTDSDQHRGLVRFPHSWAVRDSNPDKVTGRTGEGSA